MNLINLADSEGDSDTGCSQFWDPLLLVAWLRLPSIFALLSAHSPTYPYIFGPRQRRQLSALEYQSGCASQI